MKVTVTGMAAIQFQKLEAAVQRTLMIRRQIAGTLTAWCKGKARTNTVYIT